MFYMFFYQQDGKPGFGVCWIPDIRRKLCLWIALHTMHVEHDDMSMHKSLIHITTMVQGTRAHMWMLSRGYACCDPDQKDCSACSYPKLRVLGPGCLDFLGLLNQQPYIRSVNLLKSPTRPNSAHIVLAQRDWFYHIAIWESVICRNSRRVDRFASPIWQGNVRLDASVMTSIRTRSGRPRAGQPVTRFLKVPIVGSVDCLVMLSLGFPDTGHDRSQCLQVFVGFCGKASCQKIKERYGKTDCQWGRQCRREGPGSSRADNFWQCTESTDVMWCDEYGDVMKRQTWHEDTKPETTNFPKPGLRCFRQKNDRDIQVGEKIRLVIFTFDFLTVFFMVLLKVLTILNPRQAKPCRGASIGIPAMNPLVAHTHYSCSRNKRWLECTKPQNGTSLLHI